MNQESALYSRIESSCGDVCVTQTGATQQKKHGQERVL